MLDRTATRLQSALVPGLALLALFLPVRSAQQALFAASFALALATMALWGGVFGRLVLRVPRVGPWTAVYLGQYVLLAAAAPILAMNGLIARATGRAIPIVVLIVGATLALVLARRRELRPPARLDLLALLGLGSVALVVSIYSGHLSALGLDLHEHVAWTRQILDSGHVPLDEPGTGILADYPRTFHLLSALWNAAGLAPPAGPTVKAMPFLQNALPALALAEQMVDAQAQERSGTRHRWEIALGLAFYVYAFLVVPMVYPVPDLLGTPRFSSGGLLLLPVVLIAIGRAQNAPGAAILSVATAPLIAAWSLTWNPIIVVLLGVATVPVAAAVWLALRPPGSKDAPARRALLVFGASAVLGVLVLVQDPWVVGRAAQRVPVCSRIVHRSGLMTFDEAVALGRATPRDKSVRNAPASPSCRDAGCVLRLAVKAAGDALRRPWIALRAGIADLHGLVSSPSMAALRDAFKGALPFGVALIADYAGLPFVACLAAAVLVCSWLELRRRRGAAVPTGLARGLLVATLLGTTGAGIGLDFAAGLAGGLNDQRHESVILAGYLAGSGLPVSLALLWLPFAAAALVLAERQPGQALPETGQRRPALAVGGLLLWLALPLFARLNLHRPLQHRGFRTPIGLEDLRALRQVEEAIPPEDGVIIPAEHANIANWEHWVLPLGSTAALLPYGERRYLFNVYIGASYPLSWRDLDEGLCSSDPAARARFLERTRIRWALVNDPGAADAAAALERPRTCSGHDVPLSALGAELPAVRQSRGIFLFRVRGGTKATQR